MIQFLIGPFLLAVCRDAAKIASNSLASVSKSSNRSGVMISVSPKNSNQNTVSSISSTTTPILEMNSALDRALQTAR